MTGSFNFLAARIDRGMTQREIAAACGVSLTTVQRLEANGPVTPRNAKKVADYFGIAPTDLPGIAERVAPC